jgi:hypothetical protein
MTGEVEFTGYSPEGQTRQRFIVQPGAYDRSKPFRGWLWPARDEQG